MKKYPIAVSLFMLLFFTCAAQTPPDYGSNNGKYLSINNTKIYYEEYGAGVPLLLLHGGLGSIGDFSTVISALSKSYRVIAFDRPGHGRSEHTDTLTYHLMADYTSGFIDKLNLDSVYIVGWSDGGNTAFLTALLKPGKVKKIISLGAEMKTEQPDTALISNIKSLTPEFVENNWQDWLKLYKQLTPQFSKWRKYINNITAMWLGQDISTEEELKKIACPVLVVIGDKDFVTPEAALKMHRTLKGSQLCIMPNTTHFIFKEQAELSMQLIISFLKGK